MPETLRNAARSRQPFRPILPRLSPWRGTAAELSFFSRGFHPIVSQAQMSELATFVDALAHPPDLSPGNVHIAAAHLSSLLFDPADAAALLPEADRLRATRFHADRDGRVFVLSRVMLRGLLGGYLSCDPWKLEFDSGPMGKPYVVPGGRGPTPGFSVSHSSDVVLIGFCGSPEIGVDVEAIPDAEPPADIADRCFSASEWAQLSRIQSTEERHEASCRAWTRKEAFLKALGRGLSVAPREVEVTVLPGVEARLLSTPIAGLRTRSWRIIDVPTFELYTAACVVPSRFCVVEQITLPTRDAPPASPDPAAG